MEAAPAPAPKPAETPKVGIAPTKPIPVSILPRAREGKPLAWDPDRRRFELSDWIITGAGGALALAGAIVPPFTPPRQGGILFDESVRNALRLHSVDTRGFARDLSDVLLSTQVMGPFLVDVLTTAWWYRGSKDVAQQMALIDLETLAVAAGVHGVLATVIGRERPYGRTCGNELPATSTDCSSSERYRSFYSGHSTLAFTSASLVCSHHLRLHLFENGPTDVISCVSAMAFAGVTATLRVMSDEHYTTDVLTGAALGTGIGLALPYLLHYRKTESTDGAPRNAATDFTIKVVPNGTGLGAMGTF